MKISEKDAKEIYQVTKAAKDEKEFISKLAVNSLLANTEIEEAEETIRNIVWDRDFIKREGRESIVRGSDVAKIIAGFYALQKLLESFKNGANAVESAVEPKTIVEEVTKK